LPQVRLWASVFQIYFVEDLHCRKTERSSESNLYHEPIRSKDIHQVPSVQYVGKFKVNFVSIG
jgi:hypothetical protein